MPDAKPDLKTFLTDPRFQADRDLFAGFIDAHLTLRAEEARKKTEEERAKNPPNIFDVLFGGEK